MYPRLWIVTRGHNDNDLIDHVSDPTFDLSIAGVGVRHKICEDLYVKTKILQSVTFCQKYPDGNNVDLSNYVTSDQLQQTAQTLTNLVTVSLGDFYPKSEMDEKLSSIPTIRNEFEKDIFNDIT